MGGHWLSIPVKLEKNSPLCPSPLNNFLVELTSYDRDLKRRDNKKVWKNETLQCRDTFFCCLLKRPILKLFFFFFSDILRRISSFQQKLRSAVFRHPCHVYLSTLEYCPMHRDLSQHKSTFWLLCNVHHSHQLHLPRTVRNKWRGRVSNAEQLDCAISVPFNEHLPTLCMSVLDAICNMAFNITWYTLKP